MNRVYLLVFFLIYVHIARAQNVFIADSGEVTFYSWAPLEDIKASCSQVNSMINSVNSEVAFMIPIRGFRFAKALMQEHFNEKYMESDKFPHATYKGILIGEVDYKKPGKYSLKTSGKLKIHGVEKEVEENGELEVSENKLTLNSTFHVVLSDYNIVKPQLLFKNIADTIEVRLFTVYHPFIKK